jgi:hypothetical protein
MAPVRGVIVIDDPLTALEILRMQRLHSDNTQLSDFVLTDWTNNIKVK